MRALLLLAFAVSGFAGLIYESIWTHYLKLFLGHAAYAQTLVLAIFMGGMAGGAWLCGRWSHRWSRLLRAYALVEGVIGLFALLFHPLFETFVAAAYGRVIPALGSPAMVDAFKWTAATLLILPQSILLGTTFPLMSAGIIRRFPQRPGETISLLYFSNSLGGALGVLGSGFVLIAWTGLPGTIAVAGALNLALAAFVWGLAGKEPERPLPAEPAAGSSRGGNWYPFMLAAALVTGLASFIYEIVWIRMLNMVLGSSTHAFELMLSAFILGLACGGLWIRRRIDGFAEPARVLAFIQIAMGALAVATLVVYGPTFGAMQWLVENLPRNDAGYQWFNLGSHGIALLVMLPATFCAGTTLPLITHILVRSGRGEGSIGSVYAANTVGAIAGVFIAVHLGLPLLGLKGSIVLGAALDMGLGLALLWRLRGGSGVGVPAWAAAGCTGVLVAALAWAKLDPLLMASGVYRQGALLSAIQHDVVDVRHGKTATVHVTLAGGQDLAIRTNGKVDASVTLRAARAQRGDEVTQVLLGALPRMLLPDARSAAVIGIGSGISSHVLLSGGRLERVDTIEIEPAMVDLARHFGAFNGLVYEDPRSHIHIEDAKSYFSSAGRRYHVIVSEPSNPWVSGVAGLFSEEFYRLARGYLHQQGIFVQWLQLYEIDFSLVTSVLKALDKSFAHYAVYLLTTGDMVIAATNAGPIPRVDAGAFTDPVLAAELARVNVRTASDVELRRVADERLLRPLLAALPVRANSDYYPVLDQGAVRARYLRRSVGDFLQLSTEPAPILEMAGVRERPRPPTRFSPGVRFPASDNGYVAILVRDLAGGEDAAMLRQRATAGYPGAMQILDKKQYACDAATAPGTKAQALFDIAAYVAPYLAPEELPAVWRWLDRQPCGSDLGALEQRAYALARSVGERDTPRIAALANELLATGRGLPEGVWNYVVTTALAANLALGNGEAARAILDRDARVAIGDPRQSLSLRLLAARAASLDGKRQ